MPKGAKIKCKLPFLKASHFKPSKPVVKVRWELIVDMIGVAYLTFPSMRVDLSCSRSSTEAVTSATWLSFSSNILCNVSKSAESSVYNRYDKNVMAIFKKCTWLKDSALGKKFE